MPSTALRPKQVSLLRRLVDWDREQEEGDAERDFSIVRALGGSPPQVAAGGPDLGARVALADPRELHRQGYIDVEQRGRGSYRVDVRPAAHEYFRDDGDIAGAARSTAPPSDLENVPFTVEEQAHISVQVREIQTFLLTVQQVADDRHEHVVEQLRYLDEAGRRLGRKDWFNAAIGVVVSTLCALALDPQKAREAWAFAWNTLMQVAGRLRLPQ